MRVHIADKPRSRTVAAGACLPYRRRTGMRASGHFDPPAKPSANGPLAHL